MLKENLKEKFIQNPAKLFSGKEDSWVESANSIYYGILKKYQNQIMDVNAYIANKNKPSRSIRGQGVNKNLRVSQVPKLPPIDMC